MKLPKRIIHLCVIALAFSVFFGVVHPQKAAAITENNNEIPGAIINIMTTPQCRQGNSVFNYAQFAWLSPAGQAKVDSLVPSIDIPYGTDSYGLWLNNLTAVCNNNINASGNIINKDKSVTRARVLSATADNGMSIASFLCQGSNALNGSYQDLNYNSAYFLELRYIVQAFPSYTPNNTPFCLTGLSALSPGDHTITVTVVSRMIHQSRNGSSYTCVELNNGNVQGASSLDDGACGNRTTTLLVNVRVGPRPDTPPNGNVTTTCDGLAITGAEDPDVPGQPVHYDVYYRGGGIIAGSDADANSNAGSMNLWDLGVTPGAQLSVAFYNYRSDGTQDNSKATWRDVNWNLPSTCPPKISTITPRGQAQFDNKENPSYIDLDSWTTLTGPPHGANVVRTFTYVQNGIRRTIPLSAFDTPPGSNPATTSINGIWGHEILRISNPVSKLGLNAGDEVCVEISVDPTQVEFSYAGGQTITQGLTTTTPSPMCDRIVNLPYMSFQGGDVSAGGDFTGGVCSTPAGINTNVNAAGLGAGVEFAALAIGNISGFASARGHGSANSLMFSNTTAPPGQFGGSHCIKDYYSSAPSSVTPGSNISVSGLTTSSVTYNGPFTLNGGTLGNGVRTGLYINGDLIIAGNIDYASANWPTLDDIPSLHIYVKGNIYIQENVTSINAMLVAQPNATPNSGKIVTCASGTSPVPVAQLFARCGGASGNRLTVRGALIANKVEFLRTSDSLRNASGDGGANAAELVDLSPEFLLVAPRSNSNVVPKDYQYFTTLPPVL